MNIAYLPLDSRPCNFRFPAQLAKMVGVELIMPAIEDMDHYGRPSNRAAIEGFMDTFEADALIVSVDQLAYGSLLESRADKVREEEAKSRAEAIRRAKKRLPKLLVYATSVIIRSSISTLSTSDIPHYRAMSAYSYSYHKYLVSGEAYDLQALDQARAALPRELVRAYHRVRERNHQINRLCLEMCAEGAIDELLLLQEDAEQYGMHRLEQERLRARIDSLKISDRAYMHNGADEAGCLMLLQAIAPGGETDVIDLRGGECGFVAKYEDRPFMENIMGQLKCAGLKYASGARNVICVLPPKGNQLDVPDADIDRSDIDESDRRAAELLARLKGEGRRVGLLDVKYANGGSIGFMELLSEYMNPLELDAYSAWNTASNSLGTLIAQMALGERGPKENARFTRERVLDDLIYQSDARQALGERLIEQNEDPYRLMDKQRAEAMLSRLMRARVSVSPVTCEAELDYTCSLPWERTFEADIRVAD